MAEHISPCAICLTNCCAHYCELQSLLCSTAVDTLSAGCLLQTVRFLYLFCGCCGFSFLPLPLPALLPSPWICACDLFWERRSNPTHFRSGLAFLAENSWSDTKNRWSACADSLVCIHGTWTIIPLSPLFQVCKDLDEQRFCVMWFLGGTPAQPLKSLCGKAAGQNSLKPPKCFQTLGALCPWGYLVWTRQRKPWNWVKHCINYSG